MSLLVAWRPQHTAGRGSPSRIARFLLARDPFGQQPQPHLFLGQSFGLLGHRFFTCLGDGKIFAQIVLATLGNGWQQMDKQGNQSSLRLSFGVHHAPVDAPLDVVRQIESMHQSLKVSMRFRKSKVEYIANCISKSKSYVSRMTTGERPIPEKLIGPLCAATGTNLIKQYKAFHDALQSISCEPSYEQRVARLARLMEAA